MVATALLTALLMLTPNVYQHDIFVSTNRARHHHHVHRVKHGACVQHFAERHAREMARQHRMFHSDLGPVLLRCHMVFVGENVAYGYPSGRAAVRAWMHSPDHRENMLDRRFYRLGTGARKSGGVWYSVQLFGVH